jgi:peptidoglycan lytic transglycosylase G
VPGAHTRKHTFALLFVFAVVIVVGAAVFAGMYLWTRIGESYKGYEGAEAFVEIPQGAGTAEIRRRLIEAGVVRDEYVFRAALWWSGEDRTLKAGEYRFDQPMSAVAVLQKIGRGDVYARRITFPEGLTIAEMARLYQMQGFGPAPDFIAAASDASPITSIDPQAPDLEGYLFPETYALPRGVPASRLIAMMVDRFLATYTDDLRQSAEAQGLTTRQIVTLASLVEKETAKAEERPLVAAVYRNRMKIGMGMQADPTVVYALEKAGRYDGNIRREDLQFDSPYNTYKYAGLPPGPIASPGKASLEAALAPAAVPYIYFVSRNDGSHVFAETLAQHNANVHEYQVLFFRRQREEQQRAR